MKRFLWPLVIVLNLINLLAIASRVEIKNNSVLPVACGIGMDQACVTLGWRYSRGWSGPVDPPKALAIFEKGCARGGAKSCRSAGDFYDGWPEGMYAMPEDAKQKEFRERIRNRSRAIHFYGRGCDEGDAQACDSLGKVHHETGNDVEAVEAWLRACRMNSFFGCNRIEQLKSEGNQIAAASVMTRGSDRPFGGAPKGMLVWLATLLLSIITGIVAAVTRPADASRPPSRRRQVIVAIAVAVAMIALTIGLRLTSDNRMDRLVAYAIAVPATLLSIGTAMFAIKGDSSASRALFLVGGFISLPPGLIPIMIVHECRVREFGSIATSQSHP